MVCVDIHWDQDQLKLGRIAVVGDCPGPDTSGIGRQGFGHQASVKNDKLALRPFEQFVDHETVRVYDCSVEVGSWLKRRQVTSVDIEAFRVLREYFLSNSWL